jgi:hypothetical protein
VTETAPVLPGHTESAIGFEPQRRWLITAILFVVAARLSLYWWSLEYRLDFDLLYHAASHLLRGSNPYPIATQWYPWPLFYPLPAVLVAAPFTLLPLELARVAFDIVVGSTFAYALWRRRGPYALLALGSGAYLFAMRAGQITPLVVAAGLIPSLGFLLTAKPNIGLALWLARPNRRALASALMVVLFSLIILPSWPLDWVHALQTENQHLRPPIFRPFGFLLLLAAFRWKTPGGAMLLALALIPQNTLPHELVPLAVIPGNLVEMGIYVAGTFIALAVTAEAMDRMTPFVEMVAALWPTMLMAVYLPMLYLVLRQPTGDTRS